MYPGQTAPDRLLRTDSDSATDAPMGPQNEVKRTLEGESRTKCTQDRRLRTRRHSPLTPHRSAPLNPVRTGPPKRGEKIFGGRVQNKMYPGQTAPDPTPRPWPQVTGATKPPEPRSRWPRPPKRSERNFGGRVQNKMYPGQTAPRRPGPDATAAEALQSAPSTFR